MIELTLVEYLTGLFNLIFVIISLIIGVKILLKYFEVKYKHLISLGLMWILMSAPWMHGALAFVLLFFNIILAEEIRFIILYSAPFASLIWINTYTVLQNVKKRKLIVVCYAIIFVVCEILFYAFLIIDRIHLLGYFERTFQGKYSLFVRITGIFFVLSVVFTFFLFARKSIKSGGELRLKGIFLIIAFITYTFCFLMDVIFLFNPFIVVLIRLLLVCSSIEFYFGWILPEPVKKIFLKKKNSE